MGQSVTWTVPVDALPEPMGIASAPGPKQEDLMVFTPPDGNNPPVIMMTNLAVEGSTPSGASVDQQSDWYSGILDPGESYTLTFSEPGVYRYIDTGQGNTGVIVVEDPTQTSKRNHKMVSNPLSKMWLEAIILARLDGGEQESAAASGNIGRQEQESLAVRAATTWDGAAAEGVVGFVWPQ